MVKNDSYSFIVYKIDVELSMFNYFVCTVLILLILIEYIKVCFFDHLITQVNVLDTFLLV